jgi:hypothetical protein
MTNPHRGEAELIVNGELNVLRFTMNSLCALEEELGEPVAALADKMKDPAQFRISMARAVLWAGLLHKRRDLTIEQAGEIIDEAGITATMAAIGKAFSLAFATPKPGDQGRPRKAAAR